MHVPTFPAARASAAPARTAIVLMTLCAVLLASARAQAESISLKDGSKVRGDVTRVTAEGITVKIANKTRFLRADEIEPKDYYTIATKAFMKENKLERARLVRFCLRNELLDEADKELALCDADFAAGVRKEAAEIRAMRLYNEAQDMKDDVKKARRIYEDLKKKYPDTQAARLADGQLGVMDGKVPERVAPAVIERPTPSPVPTASATPAPSASVKPSPPASAPPRTTPSASPTPSPSASASPSPSASATPGAGETYNAARHDPLRDDAKKASTDAQNLLLEGIGLLEEAPKRKVLERAIGEYEKTLGKLNRIPVTDSNEFNQSVKGIRDVVMGDLVITYNELCELELKAGKKDKAIAWNKKALEIEPDNWHATDLKKRIG